MKKQTTKKENISKEIKDGLVAGLAVAVVMAVIE
jgi:hypothetical protein